MNFTSIWDLSLSLVKNAQDFAGHIIPLLYLYQMKEFVRRDHVLQYRMYNKVEGFYPWGLFLCWLPGGDLALVETSLLFFYSNDAVLMLSSKNLHKKSSEISIKRSSHFHLKAR